MESESGTNGEQLRQGTRARNAGLEGPSSQGACLHALILRRKVSQHLEKVKRAMGRAATGNENAVERDLRLSKPLEEAPVSCVGFSGLCNPYTTVSTPWACAVSARRSGGECTDPNCKVC